MPRERLAVAVETVVAFVPVTDDDAATELGRGDTKVRSEHRDPREQDSVVSWREMPD
ncbi:hypothetical protein [Streptosporangium subroseum]|uniref:hypothetical protein n=1 Tax=Streptosporangium subroseum TaxID=106412 RepID=UPI00308F4645|nr:hypothetical protein OHB15_25370 [Streptosporangium subroseum]